jgi:nicotinamidase-related amidase
MVLDPITLGGAVLVLIDFQMAFDAPPWSGRWNIDLDANAVSLLLAFRSAGLPVVHVRHDSIDEGSTLRRGERGNAFRPGLQPLATEQVVSKSVNAAFIGTDLDLRLRRLGFGTLIVCGISTDMCVSTSVRVGANLGWDIVLVEDACESFDIPDRKGGVIPAALVHEVHLATLAHEFCRVVDTGSVLQAVTRWRASASASVTS